jgi:hypothetical protein
MYVWFEGEVIRGGGGSQKVRSRGGRRFVNIAIPGGFEVLEGL